MVYVFFFFNDTATTEIYTLSLHDALPILGRERSVVGVGSRLDELDEDASGVLGVHEVHPAARRASLRDVVDRKSTRLNSSHANISYAVFCLKKKKKHINNPRFSAHLRKCY